ncbi:MAG: ArsR/SmtB family transcription factor [Candidatus Hodarchaeota archaeon]
MSSLEKLVEECKIEDVEKYRNELVALAKSFLKNKTLRKEIQIFKSLADPTRLTIIRLLKLREMCVCELTIALNLSQPTISYHLNMLENVEIVTGKSRGKWTFYALTDRLGKKLVEKIDELTSYVL